METRLVDSDQPDLQAVPVARRKSSLMRSVNSNLRQLQTIHDEGGRQ
jgi:hypothetical protein